LRVAQVPTAVLRWIEEVHLPTKRQALPLSGDFVDRNRYGGL